jgi:uncharacterized protein YceK
MASRRVGGFLAGLVVASLSGCGTVVNLAKDREVYGGVRMDTECGVKGWDIWSHPSGHAQPVFPYMSLLAAAYWVGVDLPLAAVCDTLTLPVTIPAALKKSATPTDTPSDKTSLPPTVTRAASSDQVSN